MELSRIGAVLSIIAVILSAGSIVYVQTMISGVNESVSRVEKSLSDLGAALGVTSQAQAERILAAKKEGKVVFYTAADLEIFTKVFEKFTTKYGIPVEIFRASATEVQQRIVQEASAGQNSWDISQFSHPYDVDALQKNLLAKYESPEAKGIPPTDFPANTAYYRGLLYSITYNTKNVKKDEAPKGYDDLLLPRWKGRLVIEDAGRGGGGTWTWMQSMIDQGLLSKDYFKKLAQNKPLVSRGHTATLQRLIAGELDVMVNAEAPSSWQAKAKGANIEVVPIPKMFVSLTALGISAKAPHPNAARLAFDWILSLEGQGYMKDYGEMSVRLRPEGWPAGYNPELIYGKAPKEKPDSYTQFFIDTFGKP